MNIPDNLDAPLDEVEVVQRILVLLVQGRRAEERSGNLLDLVEGLLAEIGRPMEIAELLNEFDTRHPGRTTKSSLRSTVYRAAKDGPLTKVGPSRFGLRVWQETGEAEAKLPNGARLLGSGISPTER